MAERPIACSLSPDALRTRRDGLLQQLLQRAEHYELTDEGLSIRFSPAADMIAMLARVVDAERQCCRFMRFVIVVDPDDGPVSLRLSGPSGTREFLAGLLNL
jgi:hypothetical protein